MVVRDALAPELNACIVSRADELGLEAQIEIGIFLLAHEEFVVGNFLVQKARHDGTLFHPEEFLLSLPTLEGFSIKERDEAFFLFLLGCAKAGNKQK